MKAVPLQPKPTSSFIRSLLNIISGQLVEPQHIVGSVLWRGLQLTLTESLTNMARWVGPSLDALIPLTILLHLLASPYTKVEESFNIQAVHDIIAYGLKLSGDETSSHIRAHYDHVDFPGSVPRTFTGALLLAGLTQPVVPYLSNVENVQVLVRCLLGLLVAASLIFVRTGVSTAYGKVAGRFFVAFTTGQFHIMYYASRTLPNIFAFALTNVATALLLQADSRSRKQHRKRAAALYCLTVAGIVFRSELSILLLTTTLTMLARRRVSLWSEIIPAGILGALVGLSITVGIDSILWCRWTWPELEGFYYNTVLGKSSDWGTSPFYFYFFNALPRLMLNPLTYLICIPFAPGLRSRPFNNINVDTLLPHVAFTAIYSAMPHKEWRFVMYSIPAFTAVASGGAAWIWSRRHKVLLFALLTRVLFLSIAATYTISLALLWVSSSNYPGGEALHRLHQIEHTPKQNIYLDNLACQTGVTRFLQIQPAWSYDKTEDKAQLSNPQFWQQFDYVITENPKAVPGNWQVKDSVVSFAGITLSPEEQEDTFTLGKNSFLSPLINALNAATRFARTKLTGGHWPTVRFKTKLYILERERIGLKDDIKMTIQM